MNLSKFTRSLLLIVREWVQPALDDLGGRIKALQNEMTGIQKQIDAIPEPLAPEELVEEAAKLVVVPEPQPGEKGDPGKSVAPEDVRPMLQEMVSAIELPVVDEAAIARRAADLIEVPEPVPGDKGDPGESVTVDDLIPLIERRVETAVDDKLVDVRHQIKSIPEPADPNALAEMAAALVTLPDPIPGDKGDPGESVNPVDVQLMVAQIFEDWKKGMRVNDDGSYSHPVLEFMGRWDSTKIYQRGHIVHWGGSAWHADKETTEKPGGEDWTLFVKKGRDGSR